MEHDKYWQMFTESGDPLAYMEYRKKARRRAKRVTNKNNENI
jgi:hypothetical protein